MMSQRPDRDPRLLAGSRDLGLLNVVQITTPRPHLEGKV